MYQLHIRNYTYAFFNGVSNDSLTPGVPTLILKEKTSVKLCLGAEAARRVGYPDAHYRDLSTRLCNNRNKVGKVN